MDEERNTQLRPLLSDYYEELYRDARPQLVRVIRTWGLSPDETDEVINEAFLRLMRPGMDCPPAQPLAYLLAVARNVFSEHLKRFARVRRVGLHLDEDPNELELADRRVGDQADEVVERVAIDQMVADLPREVRQTVQMFMDGYEIRDVAKYLGVYPNAVRRWLDSFRTSLRVATGSLDLTEPSNRAMLTDIEQNFGASLRASQPTAAPRSTRERVAHAVSVLPKRQREVVARHLYEELKPRQIAADLGISPNTARVNLHHAYTALTGHLGLPKEAIRHVARSVRPRHTAA